MNDLTKGSTRLAHAFRRSKSSGRLYPTIRDVAFLAIRGIRGLGAAMQSRLMLGSKATLYVIISYTVDCTSMQIL